MFLEVVRRRNPKLINTAKQLHQTGQILPDTYILDLDSIIANASVMKKQAEESGINLFYMTKQLGRNPLVAKAIRKAGIDRAVVVDFKEALVMIDNDIPIGNIGHLVQVPVYFLKRILAHQPDYMTIHSLEMLKKIDPICQELDIKQRILVKISEADDQIYEGQYGGFHLADLPELIKASCKMKHIELAGLTSFPCFLFDGVEELIPTHNVESIRKAREIFAEHGIEELELNIPSATCVRTIPFIKALGGTQGEPGHALTGTTPLHAKLDLPEVPAMVYVSEISHTLDQHSYFYGGGYYRRGHLENILVSGKEERLDRMLPFSAENIDYYLQAEQEHEVGATVIAAFRTQIFVTRSDVAVVSGIQSGSPKLEGIFDSQGNRIRR
ncbi:YhfX family PLP-dependent enzyme [Enterococcus sp. BWT-B8]|uniref:YhfX family PLP-dependent enzyme n=1 Tax=Enterococcus sp. BWT-B8 TaxID=2885157 RepID=UPI001E5D3E69|nr:YhfX family PLP-dependent enzyme [Enterococcus sp. BWT-B8]MCB5951793.1 YhfX family PLP-dependent enzyme [Enterococcus sp. BWT-B8]